MGIQGLIPFLEKSSKRVNIAQYAGCTVAIDAYCWLHKGAFSCADKLARGDKTNAYVVYCMKFVNMLLSHNIKPILVFDGRHLPAKADTEKKRRQNREVNRSRAAELLRQDKPNEARSFLQRCVDVTHSMALDLMRECRARNVDCITAPYEADSQLAYLNMNDVAHIVITEDSDLLLFGCTRVLFKLDLAGNGVLVEQSWLHRSMGVPPALFDFDKFRHMCILSGCDYLPSLPNIGLVKACRFVRSTVDPNIHRALSRLGGHLNMNLQVPLDYRNKFVAADAMFRHQPVFDPALRRLVPLTPVPADASPPPLLTDEPLDPDRLTQLAFGNLDPFTLQQVDDWHPDRPCEGGRTNSWKLKSLAPHVSMWSADFKPRPMAVHRADPLKVEMPPSTRGQLVERQPQLPKPAADRPMHSTEEELNAIRLQFGAEPPPAKKPRCGDGDILDILDKMDSTPPKSADTDTALLESPKKVQVNPFTKKSTGKFSSLLTLNGFQNTNTGTSTGVTVQSRYFGSQVAGQAIKNEGNDTSKSQEKSLKDVSNVIEMKLKSDALVSVERKSLPAENRVEKLSDNSISSFVEELEAGESHSVVNPGEKENLSKEQTKSNRETNFKWKPSLSQMFGYGGKSPAAKSPFFNPSKSVAESRADEESGDRHNSSLPVDCEVKIAKRNPFAKVPKREDLTTSLGSQGSSVSSDSQSDILTPELELDSQEFSVKSSPLYSTSTPRPQIKVGLSKKSSGCQKSLLAMFAYKPKPKLQK